MSNGAVDQFHIHARFAGQSAGLGAFDDPVPDTVESGHAGVARIEVHFRELGHDVGGGAAIGNHVMDAGGFGERVRAETRLNWP